MWPSVRELCYRFGGGSVTGIGLLYLASPDSGHLRFLKHYLSEACTNAMASGPQMCIPWAPPKQCACCASGPVAGNTFTLFAGLRRVRIGPSTFEGSRLASLAG